MRGHAAAHADWTLATTVADQASSCIHVLTPTYLSTSLILCQELTTVLGFISLAQLRLERWREGLCVQIMHIGPYADEPVTVAKMDAFAVAKGYRMAGLHHEIYLGDPRRAAPDKLKTVLRHPVEKAG